MPKNNIYLYIFDKQKYNPLNYYLSIGCVNN